MQIVSARVAQRMKEAADAERTAQRSSQIGTGARSEKIRTYNFPQNRCTDHRIGFSSHQLEEMMEGGEIFDELVQELTSQDEMEQIERILKDG